jgi:hypothetical protein
MQALGKEDVQIDTRHRVGVYGWSPGHGGVHHHRIAEPLRVLRDMGNHAFHGQALDDVILSQVDTVLVHTLHTEQPSEAWQRLAKLQTHRLVIDVDDWMWNPDYPPFREAYTPDVLDRLYRNIEAAHVVTTPSPVIAEYLTRFNRNVWYVPNTVPGWLLDVDMEPRPYPVVGYQGSPSHAKDWTAGQLNQLGRFLSRHPLWRLRLYGGIKLHTGSAPDLLQRTTTTSWMSVQDYYRTVSMDVGLGPLRDTPFNRAKSGLRAQEYAALGIVAVLPDHPIYRPWIESGHTGRLVYSHETLSNVLGEVAEAHDWRRRAAQVARAKAAQWTTENAIESWVEAWHSQ